MPEEAFYLEGVQVAKRGTAMDIQRFFPEITGVKFTENFKVEPKKAELKPEKEAKPAAEAKPTT
jgi:hypothetical protein